jgi:hypothetical protein
MPLSLDSIASYYNTFTITRKISLNKELPASLQQFTTGVQTQGNIHYFLSTCGLQGYILLKKQFKETPLQFINL